MQPIDEHTDAGRCPIATHFDPFAHDYQQDPYPILKLARQEDPVFYSERLGYWVVTRHADVRQIFRDRRTWSASITQDPVTPLYDSSVQTLQQAGVHLGPALVNEDPPTHTAKRRLLNDWFLPHNVAAQEDMIRELVREHIDNFVQRGSADLVTECFRHVPALVAFKIMGIPDEDLDELKHAGDNFVLFQLGKLDEDQQLAIVDDLSKYWDYCRSHISRLMEHPGDDFISDAVRAHWENPDLLTVNDLYNLMVAVLAAGHETTTNAAANAMRVLLQNPKQWGEVCRHPDLAAQAAEEALRFDSSVTGWRRRAKVDTEIGGVTIPAGAHVLMVTGSANHDEAIFGAESCEHFDLHREKPDRHMAFGLGAHLCLGAPLARLEMRVFIEEFARRLPHMALTEGQKWEYLPNLLFRGPLHLYAEWDPTRNPVEADRPWTR